MRHSPKLPCVVACSVALSACASSGRPLTPGYHVTPARAASIGCVYDSVVQRAAVFTGVRAQHPDTAFVPQRGIDGCELLAMVGAPFEIASSHSAQGTEVKTFYYEPRFQHPDASN